MKKINQILIWLVGGLLIVNLGFLAYFWFLESYSQDETFEQNFLQNLPLPEKDALRIIFFNVGQGDAILIRLPSGQNILIDGGPDRKIVYKLDQYLPFYERKLDLVILTHPDPDHLNGLVEVVKRYVVAKILFNGVIDQDSAYLAWQKIIQEKNIEKIVAQQGQIFNFNQQAKLEVLYPLENLAGKSFRNNNDASLVLKLTFGKIKFLLTGDANYKVEKKLLARNLDFSADVLKISHHGAKDATSLDFLIKVNPSYAVISVGKDNKFSHPSLRVLRNLKKIGAEILRTDQLSDVIFESDGENLVLPKK